MKAEIKPSLKVYGSKKDELEYFIDICIKGAKQLRDYLSIDENGYRFVASTGHSNSKQYYIYGVLDEIERAGIFLIDLRDFMKDDSNPEKKDPEMLRITRNIYKSRVDQACLWSRKLSEIFLEVLLFKVTNKEPYYKHYLLVNKLDRVNKLLEDFKKYHGCESENLKFQKNELENEILALTPSLDGKKVWCVSSTKDGEMSNKRESRFKILYDSALPLMSKDQVLLVGESYMQFSELSKSLHPDFIDPDYRINMRSIDAYFGQIAILSGHILTRIKVLMNKKTRGFMGQLSKVLKESSRTNPIFKKKKIKNGDYVLAYSDLAKVVKIKKSKYGNITYRVRFLEREPLPGIAEDEFPARYVQLYSENKPLLDSVIKVIREETPNLKYKISELQNSMDKTIVHFWDELGDKHRVFGRPDLQMKKINEYLAKRNVKTD